MPYLQDNRWSRFEFQNSRHAEKLKLRIWVIDKVGVVEGHQGLHVVQFKAKLIRLLEHLLLPSQTDGQLRGLAEHGRWADHLTQLEEDGPKRKIVWLTVAFQLKWTEFFTKVGFIVLCCYSNNYSWLKILSSTTHEPTLSIFNDMALHRKVSYICLSYIAGSHFFNPTINLVQTVDFPFQYVQSWTYWNASFKEIDQMRCSWSVGALSLQSAFDTWRSITFGETPSPFYYIFLCLIAAFLIFMIFLSLFRSHFSLHLLTLWFACNMLNEFQLPRHRYIKSRCFVSCHLHFDT